MGNAQQTAQSLLAPGKGLLVVDQYVDTMVERLIPGGPTGGGHSTGQYVDLVLRAPGLEDSVSGVVLTDDAFTSTRQLRTDSAGRLAFGVRMDAERASVAGQAATDDLDAVHRKLADHRAAGALFVEWRANLNPLDVAKGEAHIDAEALARGAAASQSEELLPLVTVAMPDLASHSAAVTQAVTGNALTAVFTQMQRFEVDTSALLLRMNMVVTGELNRRETTAGDGARATLTVISDGVPADVPGIAFLSGGQPLDQACAHLSALVTLVRAGGGPWRPTFAFTRALVSSSLEAWRGDTANVPAAQRQLVQCCRQAGQAVWSPAGSPPSG